MAAIAAQVGTARRLGDLLTGVATDSIWLAGGYPVPLGVGITGISCDSRSVLPGDLFVAIRGTHIDGHSFIADAVEKGASAVIADRPDLSSNGGVGCPVIIVRGSREVLAPLAANFYGHPAKGMTVLGVTGTLGKTSVAIMLWHLWRQAGLSAGFIGSLGIRYKDKVFASSLTTPDALTLQRTLFEMRNCGVTHVVMEVSSHGLIQHRVGTIPFQAVVFTNLLPYEHSDFHPSFSHYLETKKTLLDLVVPGGKIIYNSDSQVVDSILRGWPLGNLVRLKIEHPFCSAGPVTPLPSEQQLVAYGIRTSTAGSFFNLKIPGLSSVLPVHIPLLGIGSVVNAVGACACGWALGLSGETVAGGLKSLPPIHRRMEIVYQDKFTVIDDTCGHPESFNRLFESVEAMHPAGVVLVVAIRGHRGVRINRENGKCLAKWASNVPISHLIVTESVDATDGLNLVETQERDAFLDELNGKGGIPYRYYGPLKDAIEAALESVGKNEILILAGSQGMDKGGSFLREFLKCDENTSSVGDLGRSFHGVQ